MKVAEKGTFTPLTIVLETLEEAEYLWHLLNCPLSKTFNDYASWRGYQIDYKLREQICEDFANAYNDLHLGGLCFRLQ